MPRGLSGTDHLPIARALDLCGFRRAPEAFSNWRMASSTVEILGRREKVCNIVGIDKYRDRPHYPNG